MRKIGLLIVAALLFSNVFLAGCQINLPEAETASEPVDGDTLRDGDLVIKVVDKDVFFPPPNRKPLDGKVFYQLSLELTNEGGEPADVGSWDYTIEDADGNTIEGYVDISDPQGGTLRTEVEPGGTLTMNLIYQVPKNLKNLTLTTFNSDGIKL